MKKTIAVIGNFWNAGHQQRINNMAAGADYEVRYYPTANDAQDQIGDCEIVFGRINRDTVKSAKCAKWICASRVGVNNVCDEYLYHNPECILSNSTGAYGVMIAEYLIMVCLMMLRRQPEYSEIIRTGQWYSLEGPVNALYGKRITVLGVGDLGSEFAKRARAFSPSSIVGVRRDAAKKNLLFDEIYGMSDLNQILPETDLLVMCLPGTAETQNVLSRDRIFMLPQGSYVVNVGRGSAVDQDALMDALNSEHLAAAALDVTVPEPLPAKHPLRFAKNILLTPHVAGIPTLGIAVDKTVELFCEDFENYINGRPLKRAIDRRRGY